MKKTIGMALLAVAAWSAMASALENAAGRLEVDDASGKLTGVWTAGTQESLLSSGSQGFWQLRFLNGAPLFARDAKFTGLEKSADRLCLAWTHPRADVKVRIVARTDGFELTGEVTAKAETVLELICPSDLRFRPEAVSRFVAPHTRIDGYGFAFNAGYFQKQRNRISGWQGKWLDDHGWKRLFDGKILVLRDGNAAPEQVKVTEEGRRYLSQETVAFIERTPIPVLRPSARGQYDVTWTDSKNGPLICGSRLGGTGMFWRLGTWGDHAGHGVQMELVRGYVDGTVRAAVAACGNARRKLGFIELRNGLTDPVPIPPTTISVPLRKAADAMGLEFVALDTPQALEEAERSGAFAAIVNPYEEHLPTESEDAFDASVDAVAAYVRSGGHWIECGGASFFTASVPNRYFSRRICYPTAFLDLQRLETVAGAALTLFGVQPRPPHEPWKAKRRFQVGILGHGGDPEGGYFLHGHLVYVRKGETYAPPSVRLRLGGSLDDVLAEYSAANTLSRSLVEKVDPDTLNKLVHGLFLKTGGPAKDLRGIVRDLPPHTMMHVAWYLKGGFDKEYPDHLPCHPRFGTAQEFRALIDELHAAGHLFSPYTNPTWWCDHPRGPSFQAAGEEPLLVRLDGRHNQEVYAQNDGWTVTFWHPATQAANRRTVRAFTEDFPSDLLFQDQTGGRGGCYDLNPASPSPDAYCEGLLSQIEEDSELVPLGCEDGWDRVADRDLAVFGTTFQLIPTQERAENPHNVLVKTKIPPDLWSIEPLSARLMHDKTLFYLHDLGEFVWDRRGLAWCMALGINLSHILYTDEWDNRPRRAWLGQLARIQREAMSRIAGRKLTAFVHDRKPLFDRGIDPMTRLDDGTIVSTWENVEVKANLGDCPRRVAGEDFEPYGWVVRWPGGSFSSRDVR